MSILLGLIKYVNDNKDKLKDNFVFIFQPAEEGPGGSEDMVKDGIIDYYGIDEIYGLHVNPLLDEGVIGIKKGPMMAGTIDFESEDMVKDGIIDYYGIDEIYGLHVNPLLDEGVIGIKKGPMMAGTIDFEINIVSKSAHGAMPQNGIDGIVISAEVINSLQTECTWCNASKWYRRNCDFC